MNLSPLRYKSYVWPRNPKSCVLSCGRSMAVRALPFAGSAAESLGSGLKKLTGEGDFSGEGAYAEFLKLAAVFDDDSPGLLLHPAFTLPNAYFVSLTLRQKPLPDYVEYSFEFWDSSMAAGDAASAPAAEGASALPAAASAPLFRVAAAGDTLWSLAAECGVAVERLMALNPRLRSPDAVTAGLRLRLR